MLRLITSNRTEYGGHQSPNDKPCVVRAGGGGVVLGGEQILSLPLHGRCAEKKRNVSTPLTTLNPPCVVNR